MKSCWPIVGVCWLGLSMAPLATRAQGPSVYELVENGTRTSETAVSRPWNQQQPERLSQAVSIEARPLGEAIPRSPETILKPFPFRQATAVIPDPAMAAGGEQRPPLRLSPRGSSPGHPLTASGPVTPTSAIGTVASSLAVVVGLLIAVAWLSRRFAPPGTAPLPSQAIELLGRQSLGGKQSLHLMRVGNKLLLVALSPGGAQTLTEITDPLEVEHLAGVCRRTKADSASAAFSRILSQLAKEPTADVPLSNSVQSTARGAA
jgi:flagellar biosynthetic protein FliO